MDQADLLAVAMAAKCREMIERSQQAVLDLPAALRPKHLLWMCDRIEQHAENWPRTKVHRWIGFVQCGMLANGFLRIDEVKAMFDAAKNSYGASSDDPDLVDHLDVDTAFQMEFGGQG